MRVLGYPSFDVVAADGLDLGREDATVILNRAVANALKLSEGF